METAPLKLYVPKEFMAEGMSYTILLYPFWGLGADKKDILYLSKTLEKYGPDKKYFTLVDYIEEAEYVLVPHEYWRFKRKHPNLLKNMIALAEAHHKPLLIDAGGDEAGVVDVRNARVLRINQYRFELPSYEIKIPVLCEDLLETYCGGTLLLRDKSDKPSIGFAGWAHMAPLQRIRSILKELPVRMRGLFDSKYSAKIKGVFWREKANRIFKASSRVRTEFVIRSSYSGNRQTLEGEREKNRREFVDNILSSDYSLVIRGDANEATRFYEVLSLGRIPVLIDTAVVLPLEDKINYKEFCVIIDHRDLNRGPDILADFHASLTNEQFEAMQQKAREAYVRYLRFDIFTKYLVEILRNQKSI